MNSLIIGHSQVKYFKNYVTLPGIICESYSGCKIEDLLQKPSVKSLVTGIETIHRQDNSSTRFLETIHRHN